MNDILERAVACIKDLGYECTFSHRLDSMTGREGIVVRRLPSSISERAFDGEVSAEQLYQVVCRFRSEQEAIEKADAIAAAADDMVLGGDFSWQEIYTMPQELQLDESNFYAYELRIRAYMTL